jgi:hypothetical protein
MAGGRAQHLVPVRTSIPTTPPQETPRSFNLRPISLPLLRGFQEVPVQTIF